MKKQKANSFVNQVTEESANISKKTSNAKSWLKTIALMTCFCIAVGAIFSIPSIKNFFNRVPTYDTPMLSAAEIENMITYTKRNDFAGPVFECIIFDEEDDQTLELQPISNKEYAEIYEYKGGKSTFKNMFLQKILFAASNGEINEIPKNYTLPFQGIDVEQYNFDGNSYVRLGYDNLNREDYSHSASIIYENDLDNFNYTNTITFNSKTYNFKKDISDAELKQLVKPLKNDLFEIFNLSFSDMEIKRDIGFSNYYTVCFYNETSKNDDRLRIGFTSQYVFVDYTISKNLFEETYKKHIANAKTISLEEAEKLLRKGYFYCCYGNSYKCRLCDDKQNGKITFDRYEHVSFEYSYRGDSEGFENALSIPYYVFYKELSPEERETYYYKTNDRIYLRAYVPSIEVSGYADYFASKAQLN